MKVKQVLAQAMRHPHRGRSPAGGGVWVPPGADTRQPPDFFSSWHSATGYLQEVRGMAKGYQVRQLLKLAEKHNLPIEGTDV